MKTICFISLILFVFCSCSLIDKSKEVKMLSYKVDSLSSKVEKLSEQNKVMEEEFTWIENELVELNKLKKAKAEMPETATSDKARAKVTAKPTTTTTEKTTVKAVPDLQCIAITNAGTRCSRPALKDSKYCWQHKKTYEPDKIEKKDNTPGSTSGEPKK